MHYSLTIVVDYKQHVFDCIKKKLYLANINSSSSRDKNDNSIIIKIKL